jgi:predicted nucleotidyltransferase
MTFEQVHNNQQVLLLQCISGSKAYGLDTPQSDTDIKGVFALSKRDFYGLHYTGQVADAGNDIVYYELKRFVELLTRNNPNYNKDGYSAYCKDYAQYWEWVEKRNDIRFQNTMEHGKNYDAKNMMHTFRLLNMAEEIALEKRINVFRKDREFLLKIRNGAFSYDELVAMANEKITRIEDLFAKSDLPETKAVEILIRIRETLMQN